MNSLPDLSGREWAYMMPLMILVAVDRRLSEAISRIHSATGERGCEASADLIT